MEQATSSQCVLADSRDKRDEVVVGATEEVNIRMVTGDDVMGREPQCTNVDSVNNLFVVKIVGYLLVNATEEAVSSVCKRYAWQGAEGE